MSSKNLVQDLGYQYVREFLCGACFQVDGTVYYLRNLEETVATVDRFSLSDEESRFERAHIPATALRGFETFKYPTLGYRQYRTEGGENAVLNLHTARSAQRGLRMDLVRHQLLPVFNYLGQDIADNYHGLSFEQKLRMIFRPQFTPFSTAVRQLVRGEVAGAAINENTAVGISCTRSADRAFDIYFRDRVVGRIDEKGVTHISNKVMNRYDLQKALSQ